MANLEKNPIIAPPPVPEPPVVVPEVDLFRGFTPDELKSFMSQVETVSFFPGEPILVAGDWTRALYVLTEGAVRIELPDVESIDGVIADLTPISIFGESSFFHAHPHSTSVRCTAATKALRLTRERYDEWLNAREPLAFKLMLNAAELLAGRLYQTDQWIQRTLQAREQEKLHTSWREFRSHMSGRMRGSGQFMSGGGTST